MKPYFEDEFVTLFHGDCLEVTEWLSADVLVTDPPYGLNISQLKGMYKGKGSQIRVGKTIANDQNTVARDTALKLWGEKPAIVFGTWRMPRPDETQHRLIWHKKGQQPGPANSAFMLQDEEIYILGKGFRASAPPLRSVIETYETRHHAVINAKHPTPKPLGLMEILIDRCPPGVIADPFAGSGATLLAARNLGRRVIGVELEEKYCELIANRLSQQTFQFELV